ncbi:ORF MSV103 hypothetical protein [Melanoplus sanguinipes entomopoxvirus]|uniref:Uncharacterized protein n=1 Tax=Melanoplus sanguinipes entomopoxvirus TaxID=83191 RepID=Q9YVY9_MSEPV|nr:ORF MSV103 hypothetical protein [Melanoplus sanguinipes entomopoxvirus]AAC97650.1 ORF MSV103 hypothetical protein [Melanoplus sanguinipes entomopoxvirus 'O']
MMEKNTYIYKGYIFNDNNETYFSNSLKNKNIENLICDGEIDENVFYNIQGIKKLQIKNISSNVLNKLIIPNTVEELTISNIFKDKCEIDLKKLKSLSNLKYLKIFNIPNLYSVILPQNLIHFESDAMIPQTSLIFSNKLKRIIIHNNKLSI